HGALEHETSPSGLDPGPLRGGCTAPGGLGEELVDLRPGHPASGRPGGRTAIRRWRTAAAGARVLAAALTFGGCLPPRRRHWRRHPPPPSPAASGRERRNTPASRAAVGAYSDPVLLRIGVTLPTRLRCSATILAASSSSSVLGMPR